MNHVDLLIYVHAHSITCPADEVLYSIANMDQERERDDHFKARAKLITTTKHITHCKLLVHIMHI
jgi:hypothetical protein